jgi:dGTPase
VSEEEIEETTDEDTKEIAEKVPAATDTLEQAIEKVRALLNDKKDGCTIRELREKLRPPEVSAPDLTDALAALMLAEKADYTGNKSPTVILVNGELERFIIHRLYGNNQGLTVDELRTEAAQFGYSPAAFLDALMRHFKRDRAKMDDNQRVVSGIYGPPAKTQEWERAPRGAKSERYYEEAKPTTFQFETEYAKDHERILYSSAFRRLAGVTQVFRTSEGHAFHNRLTHSLKAGQIARSIVEQVTMKKMPNSKVDIHPDVVEAAALAHDFGHPPFGHAGEQELDSLCTQHGMPDGYEGNAQNLRIVTGLSRVRSEFRGLNLTRATLNALMKYPWMRDPAANTKEHKKWNAYATETRFFDFARSATQGKEKCLEAQVMEWADDIAYGVHDIEDGVRAGMIPLSELLNDAGERMRFLEGSREWWAGQACFNNSIDEAEHALNILNIAQPDLRRPYDDDAAQQAALHQLTTVLHHRYILAVDLKDDKLDLRPEYMKELSVLKYLMRFYVFCNPVLLPQQFGQRRVVRDLFDYFYAAAQSARDRNVLPTGVRELFEEDDSLDAGARAARAAADTVAGMTELEALAMHRLVVGVEAG